jgi:hypothetical protein
LISEVSIFIIRVSSLVQVAMKARAKVVVGLALHEMELIFAVERFVGFKKPKTVAFKSFNVFFH